MPKWVLSSAIGIASGRAFIVLVLWAVPSHEFVALPLALVGFGVVLGAAQWAVLRPRVGAGRWIGFSLAGAVAGEVVLLVLSAWAFGTGDPGPGYAARLAAPWGDALSGLGAGAAFGFIQAAALPNRAPVRRWGLASAAAGSLVVLVSQITSPGILSAGRGALGWEWVLQGGALGSIYGLATTVAVLALLKTPPHEAA